MFAILIVLAVITISLFLDWIILGKHLRKYVSEPVRIDEEGKLYSLEYYGNYSLPLITLPYKIIRPVRNARCSCFYAKGVNGNPLAGRNLDLPHFDKNGNKTGLNVVLKCSPKSGYRSLAVADAADISLIGVPYYSGSLDDPKIDKRYLALLPYVCMDGVNEKGLFVSVLALDLKKGEHPAYQNKKVIIPVLLRRILDNCASLEEAVRYAGDVNLVNLGGHDFQLFIVDSDGNSGVLDWRYDVMNVTYTDIATNFYVSGDDAENCYLNGELKERFAPPADPGNYRFGYGHGYERFKTIMSMTGKSRMNGEAVMDMEEAMNTLKAVSQDYTGELTSMTQYSAVYDLKEKKLELCIYPDYLRKFSFSLIKEGYN